MVHRTLPPDFGRYLRPTAFIDSDHPLVAAYAGEIAGDAATDTERAVRAFYGVRDDIRYTPYDLVYTRETMTAGHTLAAGRGFCVQKAVLLAAVARALGVPSRLRFADVRSHLASPRLLDLLGSDLFIYHGYTELWLEGAWLKVAPTFNRSLCDKVGVPPLEFDGTQDSILHAFDDSGHRHMEYVRDHGAFADLPYTLLYEKYATAHPGLFGSAAGTAPSGDFDEEAAAEHSAPA